MCIDGKTQIYLVFASNVATSGIYPMYNAGFAAAGINAVYLPCQVRDLEKAVQGIKHLGISGVGVGIPYKITIIPFLDELDSNAKRIGAVNAIINKNKRLIGINTDGQGAVMALKEVSNIKGKKVLLMGAGGVARAIAFAITDAGGNLTIINRTLDKAQQLAKSAKCRSADFSQLAQFIGKTDILINGTSVGMAPQDNDTLVPLNLLKPSVIVQEVVSIPRETRLIKEAKSKGCLIVPARRMSLWQAALKFEQFTGVKPPIKAMEKAFH